MMHAKGREIVCCLSVLVCACAYNSAEVPQYEEDPSKKNKHKTRKYPLLLLAVREELMGVCW